MKTMDHFFDVNNNNGGSWASTAWIILTGIGAGVVKFFDSYLLADTFVIATLKAGAAACFVAVCAAAGNFGFRLLIKPVVEKYISRFKNKFNNKKDNT